jgi:hypothetical protein
LHVLLACLLTSRRERRRRDETERHHGRKRLQLIANRKIRKGAGVAKEKTSRAKPAAKASAATKKTAKKPATGAAKIQKAVKSAQVQKVVKGAKKVAANPAATEIVAATLVAAAAALRDPKKAKALALEAADDLKKAARSGAEGGALWKLALDIARRSIDAVGREDGGKDKKAKSKKKK